MSLRCVCTTFRSTASQSLCLGPKPPRQSRHYIVLMLFCMQVEKQALEDQQSQQAADSSSLRSELLQSAADCHDLTQRLSSTQAELNSFVKQIHRKEDELTKLKEAAGARELESAAELDGAKAQTCQLARQLSERVQQLDALQVPRYGFLCCTSCLGSGIWAGLHCVTTCFIIVL